MVIKNQECELMKARKPQNVRIREYSNQNTLKAVLCGTHLKSLPLFGMKGLTFRFLLN